MSSDSRRILVVEDDATLRRVLERCLVREGCEVTVASDGAEAIERLNAGWAGDLVLTDLEMPRAGGREVLQAGLARRVPVVILTGHPSVDVAVELMRHGAANFLSKPFTPASLRALLEDHFGRAPAATDMRNPAQAGLIGGSDTVFSVVLDLIASVAETDATVLIAGETGTGKELVARAIHASSRRASGPFVAVNCGAIPEPLLESELFGHCKGAFTGATQSRAGRFQLAHGGTLFLDEIGDMPLTFQVKILRVLQERKVELLGEGVSRPTDIRLVAATHRDLPSLVAEGTFREDLYYRLNVIEVAMPPLRDRPGDLPLLVEYFIGAANAQHHKEVVGASQAVLDAFKDYSWPGNIRELSNVIERMVILGRGETLQLGDVPRHIQRVGSDVGAGSAVSLSTPLPAEGIDLRRAVQELEGSLIGQALLRTGGNRNAAAELLGLNRTTLVEKLRRRR